MIEVIPMSSKPYTPSRDRLRPFFDQASGLDHSTLGARLLAGPAAPEAGGS